MTFELKPITHEAVARALEKAERYRFLNEPFFAESICLDVLAVEPDNQHALRTYILALCDQFDERHGEGVPHALEAVGLLADEYEREYYTGIVCERRGTARMARGGIGNSHMTYEAITEAMRFYERAIKLRPPCNDDALLRWNTCVRLIEQHRLEPHDGDDHHYPLE
jgi:tetratricopeptide (TPR) repeat protein